MAVMSETDKRQEQLNAVRYYHRLSKHSLLAYAPSPGFLDWDSQPNPFRRYSGAKLITLPLLKNIRTMIISTCIQRIPQQASLHVRAFLLFSSWHSV